MKDILTTIINQQKNKAITYETYMEQVLYHADKGYYMREKTKIGKEGDFYTSSSVHDVFGTVFTRVFSDIINKESLSPVICEVGGGNGSFAKSVIEEWQKTNSKPLTYIIVESSPYHRKLQRENLGSYSQVLQFESMESIKNDIPLFNGIIFSNELFDAFPVHVIEIRNEELFEIYVSIDEEGHLIERKKQCTDQTVIDWVKKYCPNLTNDQRIEIPIQMDRWIRDTAAWVTKGAMITIDYGYTKEDWKHPARREGSLRGYHKHQLVTNPLLYPGEMDLTTHIHLDAVTEIGDEAGLLLLSMKRQNQFLIDAGIFDYLQDNFDPNPFSEKSKSNRAIRTLVMDGGISSSFHVIVQGKGLHQSEKYYFTKD